MGSTKEIKFRDCFGDLVGRKNGMTFIIRTEPGMPASEPAHFVTVAPGDGAPNFSTLNHQYFHLEEAKEFCRQVADGKVNLSQLRARYDAEDDVKILDASQNLSDRLVLFRARLAAAGLSYRDLLELQMMHGSLGERGRQILLDLEREEKEVHP